MIANTFGNWRRFLLLYRVDTVQLFVVIPAFENLLRMIESGF